MASPASATRAHHKASGSGAVPSGHTASHSTASTKPTHSATGSHSRNGHKSMKAVKGKRQRGQQAIEPERVTEIQQALIREHYLDGEATGKWDTTTIAAMQKLQAKQGWQTKLTPDSRALKKLGLGPDYSNAINARDSSFVDSRVAGTTTPEQAAGFAAGAKVIQ